MFGKVNNSGQWTQAHNQWLGGDPHNKNKLVKLLWFSFWMVQVLVLPGLTPAVRVDIKPAKRRCGFFVVARRNVPRGMWGNRGRVRKTKKQEKQQKWQRRDIRQNARRNVLRVKWGNPCKVRNDACKSRVYWASVTKLNQDSWWGCFSRGPLSLKFLRLERADG